MGKKIFLIFFEKRVDKRKKGGILENTTRSARVPGSKEHHAAANPGSKVRVQNKRSLKQGCLVFLKPLLLTFG